MGNKQTEQAELAASRFIARRETGPWSETDAADLQAWLAGATLHRVVYFRLNAAWQEAGRLKALKSLEAPRFDSSALPDSSRSTVRTRAFAIAASVLMATVIALAWYWYADGRDTYSTPVGGMKTLALADGSRITLNTDTRLRILFDDRGRTVRLERGEAYFDVAHDPLRPFTVDAANRRIVAIGTQFAVRRNDQDVRVTVTEGTVAVAGPAETATEATARVVPARAGDRSGNARLRKPDVLLPAGSVATVANLGVLVQEHSIAEIEQSLTWRTGILTFHDTPLADAVAELNRYNARKIVIRDADVAAIKVGGLFGATQPEQFVHLLELGFSIQASEEGEQIIVTSRH